ncbi:MAG: AmmeMemoRadiSam system protein B [Kiritimatiellia bacterium]|nr:AmmeMemoRadiSam system protein B [Kiritimatiellia bacterium]
MKRKLSTVSRRVLRSDLAGFWYTDRPDQLRREIAVLLDRVPAADLPEPLAALILPHAGYAYSGEVAATGIRLLHNRRFRRVLVLGPSHRVALPDAAAVPDATHFKTLFGEIPLDVKALDLLRQAPGFGSSSRTDCGEHSVEILFPLLQFALNDFQLVPVVVGQLSDAAVSRLANALRPLLDRETLLVVSTDFTHYGPRFDYTPFEKEIPRRIEALDQGAFDRIRQKDLDGFRAHVRETGATICGRDSISLLLALIGEGQQVHQLAYDMSGNQTGDYENTVSYLSAAVTGPWTKSASQPPRDPASGLGEADQRALLRQVRERIEARLDPSSPPASALPDSPALRRSAGVFVTLHRNGELRGCIGEIEPRRPLVEAVADHAIHAAFGDPRFPPLAPEEWPDVEIEISVLTPPREIDSWEQIEIGRHGIFLHKRGRSAVFLPQVATEQGWDLPTTLAYLSRKAGLSSDAWREGARLDVFEAQIIREKEVGMKIKNETQDADVVPRGSVSGPAEASGQDGFQPLPKPG